MLSLRRCIVSLYCKIMSILIICRVKGHYDHVHMYVASRFSDLFANYFNVILIVLSYTTSEGSLYIYIHIYITIQNR